MNATNNGGSAFPVPYAAGIESPLMYPSEGMTLRDYFAVRAMQGMLAAAENYSTDDLVGYAYSVADAMIKAREAR